MSIKLVKLSEEYKEQLVEMIIEWRKDMEENHTNTSPWAIFKNDCADFDYYLEHLECSAENCPANRVPDSVFYALDTDRNIFVGAVNIRHRLNDALLIDGGHIGDGVRPSERRKGYATEIIRLALIECRNLGIERVLICCDRDNEGSRKSIIKNGGIMENEIEHEGEVTQRYWIER